MGIREQVHEMKRVAPELAASSLAQRNDALCNIAHALQGSAEEIFAANAADMQAAQQSGVAEATLGRLLFDEHKLNDCLRGLEQLQQLDDPLGQVLLDRELDSGLELRRVSVPIGVIGVIFEARPDALVQISSLCIKSGNCAILKGGRETANTNRVLFRAIHEAAVTTGLPESCLVQAEQHSEIDELLTCDEDVDLLIPRGSYGFVRHIMENTKIPVLGHSSGICHVYVDSAADQDLAIPVVIDSKTQYPAACNAAETLLVARSIAPVFLPRAALALSNAGVRLHAPDEVRSLLAAQSSAVLCEDMEADGFAHEYGSLAMSLAIVDDVQAAVEHINHFGSHHTDSIITTDDEAARYFMNMVDSAGVYRNCSTRFADGFRYGFGAEVGISTGKIHARGPMGLEGLTTYKYELVGNGQIVANYASGTSEFKFRDLI